jgi:hypothetical protein
MDTKSVTAVAITFIIAGLVMGISASLFVVKDPAEEALLTMKGSFLGTSHRVILGVGGYDLWIQTSSGLYLSVDVTVRDSEGNQIFRSGSYLDGESIKNGNTEFWKIGSFFIRSHGEYTFRVTGSSNDIYLTRHSSITAGRYVWTFGMSLAASGVVIFLIGCGISRWKEKASRVEKRAQVKEHQIRMREDSPPESR